ncbi:MAG: S49 family peptidase, partial [Sphingomonas taxi]
PTFEKTLAKIGVTTDGVKATPLSGQPDLFAGTTPELDTILQAGIENGYRQFLTRVGQSRRMTLEQVDQVAQGRVWTAAPRTSCG